MKRAGLRRARQDLTSLIDEVRKGREVILTDRGKPVARLAPLRSTASRPFPDRAAFRRGMPVLDPPLSDSIGRERDERL